MRDPGVRKIRALVKKRGGQYLGKSDLKKPETIGKYDRVKAPEGSICVIAIYANGVRYYWTEGYSGKFGKQLGCDDVQDYKEAS